MKDMIAICREVDKSGGEIDIYPLEAAVTGNLIVQLSLRARLNPDLRYFVAMAETWADRVKREQIGRLLSIPDVTPKMLQDSGGFVVEV